MKDILGDICAYKQDFVDSRKSQTPLSTLKTRLSDNGPVRPFHQTLLTASKSGYGLITEIKCSSPSAGIIRTDFNPTSLAKDYAAAGASCISVLTDEFYFSGHDTHLSSARSFVDLPFLRKDFIIDPYQVFESRALGADAILIIVAAVDDSLATDLELTAFELGMDVLVEVHNKMELQRALKLQTKLIGINNRNLKTMATDIGTTEFLSEEISADYTIVSESGLKSPTDLARMAQSGVRCFLIGESLLRQNNVKDATEELLRDSKLVAAVS